MNNNPLVEEISLDEMLVRHFETHFDFISSNDIPSVSALRKVAMKQFLTTGFPSGSDEKWRNTEIEALTEEHFNYYLEPNEPERDIEDMFRCEVHNFDTEIISMLNGWYLNSNDRITILPNGVVYGSLRQAMKQFPELVEKYYGKIGDITSNGFVSINTAMVQDGVFVYVPDGVEAEKTIQIIKMIDRRESLFVQSRNLIILGKNSKLSLMHCDDSINHFISLINTVSEVYVGENAHFELYKLQNLNNQSGLVNSTFIQQEANSTIKTNTLTFNCGMIRNNINVDLQGENSHADVLGLYLMDKKQHIDNQIYINHNAPHCSSNEKFKGILDDEASAVFNGYIHVARNAQKTNAYQNNNNILLKPTATINTMPFLEIYADDVKCSHGATVGQLDQEAMFYLRSRGISSGNARLLLMYAFAADIINQISIEPLRQRIDDMVKKRLRGELSVCEKCVLHCGMPEKEYHFDIDMSKL
ncbi:MAG: Fe-S cluster assembly protein SufD [Bacteroidales bacterium]|nr:Fe-S cluster assembly protein SufD [Bacteroidales bacterium]